MKKVVFLFLALVDVPGVLHSTSFASTYQVAEPVNGKRSIDGFYNSLNMPDIALKKVCGKKCVTHIVDDRGRVLRANVTGNGSVRKVASARFGNVAYALFLKTEKGKSWYFRINNRGHEYRYHHSLGNYHAISFNKKGKVVTVGDRGIYVDGELSYDAPAKLTRARIVNSPGGLISVSAIADDNRVLVSDMKQWVDTGIVLAARGDFDNVVSSYPLTKAKHYGAVYKYVNNYNKGVKLFSVDFDKKLTAQGWLYNSEDNNIGAYPEVYGVKGSLVVGVRNGTAEKSMHFELDAKQADAIEDIKPEHTNGFEDQQLVSFIIGGGLAYKAWEADSTVTHNSTTLMDVDYDIASTLYTSVFMQGRVDDVQLSFAYLQNEADEVGGVVEEASEFLSFFVDFDSLLKGAKTLRISAEKADIRGVATVTGTTPQTTQFDTKYETISALVMGEQGKYWGGQLSSYKLPGAVGFSDISGNTEAYYDDSLGVTKLSYIIGYDELAYIKRYETNISRSYKAFSGGFGIGTLDISAAIEAQAEASLSGNVNLPLFYEIGLNGEYGYIYQRRAKSLKGFGAVFQAGYQFSLIYMGAHRDNQQTPTTGLELEFDRLDLLHGPFVRAAFVF